MKQQAQGSGQVARRVVFYIPGFDPHPPRRYRELYRKEGAEQARLSGFDLALTPSDKGAAFGWSVQAQIEEASVSTRFEVLVWHDLVKAAMPGGLAATYWQLARTAWAYFGSGAIWPLMGLRKGPLIAAFYPVALLLLQLVFALAAAWLVATGLALVVPGWVAAGLALPVVWGVLKGFQRLDGRIFAHYLMHDFAYVAADGGAYAPALEARLSEFGARIRAALAEDLDEVLVVGHSSGAHMGVSVLADLIRAGLPQGPVLSLLTLGQAVPMVSFLPRAGRLRADLALMAGQDRVSWVDVSAPGDGCTFALCDPVAVTGVAPEGARWPLVLSAAFSRTLTAGKQAELKRRYFRLHFQYLCAFDALRNRADEYDYFRTTAGPLTLWARYGARTPSPGRITRAASRHRGLAP